MRPAASVASCALMFSRYLKDTAFPRQETLTQQQQAARLLSVLVSAHLFRRTALLLTTSLPSARIKAAETGSRSGHESENDS